MKTKPVKNGIGMLETISANIEELRNCGKEPNYIIIHENDTMALMHEMFEAKLLQNVWKVDALEFEGIHIIRTKDIPEGVFDIVE